ncbi:MAG TPA: zinc ribbon domain-containing protein [Pyrinomonadaceae bacterium]|nr:zinc ribbon domain-containing protein [Pyrinomonadaceae bacterium]
MNTVNCPNCRQSVSANQKFCSSCGQTLANVSAAQNQQTVNQQTAGYQSSQQSSASAAVESSAPPSLLLLFYAHNFVPAAGMLGAATVVPCQNVKVSSSDLVYQMMAAAFWHLRERKLISIETGKKQGWIFKSTPVIVRLLQHTQTTGLEHDFLEATRARQTEATVEQIIVDYLREDTPNPAGKILDRITQWAIHLGYGQHEQRQGFFKKSELNFAPDCARIGALNDKAQAFQAVWQQFQTQEAALYTEILKDCKDAVSSRTERPEHDSDIHSS